MKRFRKTKGCILYNQNDKIKRSQDYNLDYNKLMDD